MATSGLLYFQLPAAGLRWIRPFNHRCAVKSNPSATPPIGGQVLFTVRAYALPTPLVTLLSLAEPRFGRSLVVPVCRRRRWAVASAGGGRLGAHQQSSPMDSARSKAISCSREAVNALNDCVDVLTLGYYRSFVFTKSSKRRLIWFFFCK